MKRSEMLQILDDLIFSYTDNDYDGPHYDYNEILKGLEEAGMLPPTAYCFEQKIHFKCKDELDGLGLLPEWESEE